MGKVKSFAIVEGIMLIMSAVFVFLLSMILWKTDGSQPVLSIGIMLVYIVTGIAGGYMAGKIMQQQKFIWGIISGLIYFGILLAAGILFFGTKVNGNSQVISGVLECSIAGMIGGMLAPGNKKGE